MKKISKVIVLFLACIMLSACGSCDVNSDDLVEADFFDVKDNREMEDETTEEIDIDKTSEVDSDSVEETVETEKSEVVESPVVNQRESIEIEPEEQEPAYTYTEMNQTMYAKQAVNVRNLPGTEGEKVGGLSFAQEVTVTGQCNESKWYRITYNGSEAYVSNKYLVSEKPEVTVAPVPTPTPQDTNAVVNTGDNSSSGSGGASVTVPSQPEAGTNLVWVPTNGGKKYHSRQGCSNMIDPMQVTVETATANGYTPCKRCH